MEDMPEKRKLDHSEDSSAVAAEKRQAVNDKSHSDEDGELPSTQKPITVNMACPAVKVGSLIGKRGMVVQEIMKRSNCKIRVDQNYPDGHDRQVVLTGLPAALTVAMSLVSAVLENGPSVVSPVDNIKDANFTEEIEDDLTLPHAKVGTVIGHKGSNVQEIYRRTGCRIQVLQEGVADGVDRKILFQGTPEQISDAKKLVQQLMNEGPAVLTKPNNLPSLTKPTIQETVIDPEKVRVVIGSKGVTISEIMRRSGCKVIINQDFPVGEMHRVVYTGLPHQIEMAKYLVETTVSLGINGLHNLLNAGSRIIVEDVTLTQSQLNRILSSSAKALEDIQSGYGVKISTDNDPDNLHDSVSRLFVVGKEESVQTAVKHVYQSSGAVPPEFSMRNGGNNVPVNRNYNYSNNCSSQSYGRSGPSYEPVVVPEPSSGAVLALGEDGTAGHLHPIVLLSNGMYQQLAEVKNDRIGRVIGKQSSNLNLIRNKSGANLQIMKSTEPSSITTQISMVGAQNCVALAAQMVQEVLVNGIGKLQQMSDVPLSTDAMNNGMAPYGKLILLIILVIDHQLTT